MAKNHFIWKKYLNDHKLLNINNRSMKNEWKNLETGIIRQIDRLVDEYLILIPSTFNTVHLRVYERKDGLCYANVGATILDKETKLPVRPYGEGNTPFEACKNAILHFLDLLIQLDDICLFFESPEKINVFISDSHEY